MLFCYAKRYFSRNYLSQNNYKLYKTPNKKLLFLIVRIKYSPFFGNGFSNINFFSNDSFLLKNFQKDCRFCQELFNISRGEDGEI